jgi:hypothetical protein
MAALVLQYACTPDEKRRIADGPADFALRTLDRPPRSPLLRVGMSGRVGSASHSRRSTASCLISSPRPVAFVLPAAIIVYIWPSPAR